MKVPILLRCLPILCLLASCHGSSGNGPSTSSVVPQNRTFDFTVALDNVDAMESATYVLTFETGEKGALASGDTITVTAPQGTDFADSSVGWTAVADGTEVVLLDVAIQSTEPEQALNQFVATLGSPIEAETEVVMTVRWVNNPGPGVGRQLRLTTTSEPEERLSSPYDIEGVGRVEWVSYQDSSIKPFQCLGHNTGTTDCGVRGYMVYDPAEDYRPRRPLLVDLHGCTNSAANESRWSRFHELAAERDFVLLFPQQSLEANGGRCWNWFSPEHQHRDAGEPGLIAGMIRDVVHRYGIDPDRIYISGISAGGVMSSIMMATYPDLFAAGAVLAGCPYQGLPCFGGPTTQPPAVSAQAAVDEAGSLSRSVPLFAVTGDLDPVVPPENAEFLVQQWLAIHEYQKTGQVGVVPVLPSETSLQSPEGKQSYTLDIWRDEFGCLIAQRWTVHQMAHQWAGAESNGSPQDQTIANPQGPDLRTAIVDFFLSRDKSSSCLP